MIPSDGLISVDSTPARPSSAASSLGSRPLLLFDRQFRKETFKLQPGEFAATGLDLILTTVLGSCVAACLYDPVVRVGGMNHFLLPGRQEDGCSGRYGMYAMELLINEILRRGGQRNRLLAKAFGGGAVLGSGSSLDVGNRNASFIEEYLEAEGIPLLGSDLRGQKARRVVFFPATGQALVRPVDSSRDHSDWQEEQRYAREVGAQASQAGAVELF